ALDDLLPFDLIWCTGVLYHNPEQLRMIARLFDWTAAGGHLVLETATAPRTTVQTPFEWSKGDGWKAKVFTQDQPWQTEEVKAAWLEKKALYRKLREEGKV
ncbi:MAG: hypothetical protein HN608_12970, partial [Rhodospirillaceae bacterium]|nr:hypothetical protein [Rhodospirillaceae bacterium]